MANNTRGRADTARKRFMKHVNKNPKTNCWEWIGACDSAGYGRFRAVKVMIAHKYAFEELKGQKLGDKQVIMHTCDNPKCVNPEHLFAGSHCENMQDRYTKGRNSLGQSKRLESKIRSEIPDATPNQIAMVLRILGLSDEK